MILLVVTISVLLILYYLKCLFTDPPGPKGLPFMGIFPFILLQIKFQKNPNENNFFQKMYRKHGQVWSFRSNGQRYIVLASIEAQTEAFKDLGKSFAGRPLSSLHKYVSARRGVLSSDGDIWKFYRKLTTKALHGIAVHTGGFEEVILENVDKLTKFIDLNSNQKLETSTLFHSLSMAIILQIMFNEELEITDPRIQGYTRNVGTITSANLTISSSVFSMTAIPLIKHMFPHTLRMRRSLDEIKDVLTKFWKDFKKRSEEKEVPDECIGGYFLNQLNEKNKNTAQSAYLNEFNFIQNFADIASAGSDTVAATLSWCCLMLAKQRDVQEILRQEIVDFLEYQSVKTIRYSDRSNLPNICSFIEEIHRFFTIIPRTVHRPMETVSFHGYVLSENDIVLGDSYAFNHDPNVWDDPDNFHFDRFVERHEDVVQTLRGKLNPFGIGKRNCIGENLARVEIFMTLTAVLYRYRIMLSEDAEENIDNIMAGVNGLVHTPLHHGLRFCKL